MSWKSLEGETWDGRDVIRWCWFREHSPGSHHEMRVDCTCCICIPVQDPHHDVMDMCIIHTHTAIIKVQREWTFGDGWFCVQLYTNHIITKERDSGGEHFTLGASSASSGWWNPKGETFVSTTVSFLCNNSPIKSTRVLMQVSNFGGTFDPPSFEFFMRFSKKTPLCFLYHGAKSQKWQKCQIKVVFPEINISQPLYPPVHIVEQVHSPPLHQCTVQWLLWNNLPSDLRSPDLSFPQFRCTFLKYLGYPVSRPQDLLWNPKRKTKKQTNTKNYWI